MQALLRRRPQALFLWRSGSARFSAACFSRLRPVGIEMTIAEVSHAIQSTGFFTSVRQSALFYPTVMATHLTCIAIFGGMILMTDLRLLGLALTSTPIASVIESTRNWKRFGFVLMVSCGILLAGSKLDTY